MYSQLTHAERQAAEAGLRWITLIIISRSFVIVQTDDIRLVSLEVMEMNTE